jgi:TRAP-type C4-dicarboxylate transport system permease large subunit
MSEIGLILLLSFGACLALNVPIVVAIALASALGVWAMGGDPAQVVSSRLASGVDSFALLAIPFFIVAGNLMARGGIATRLIDLAAAVFGRFRGGLACVNTVSCMLFGAVSGSAAAAVSSIGSFMIPADGGQGLQTRVRHRAHHRRPPRPACIIPPSNIMIVLRRRRPAPSRSPALFLAGVLPGILDRPLRSSARVS